MTSRLLHAGSAAVLAVVLTGCTASEQKEPKAPATALAASRPFAGRSIILLLDLSLSFGNMADANRKLTEIAAALGPGDEFVLVQFGGPFDETKNVVVDAAMPAIPPDLLLITANAKEWKQKQRRLNAIWTVVETNRRAIREYLPKVKLKTQPSTPLDDALAYASTRLAKAKGERHLLILSDLVQDSDRVKREGPPMKAMSFGAAHVTALFVPWNRDWDRLDARWRDWFKLSRASEFHMYDGSQSRGVSLIPMSGAARLVPGGAPEI